MIGEKLGPYEILSSIGSGGMGEVWKARDTRLGRIVAIKKVKEQHSERFKQEARTIAALNHPNICQIHDIGDNYLVLEYIEGKPLPSPLPEQKAARLAIQIAAALEAAHKKGIIHRDLKPSNIMVTDEGIVKLLDFGLAKLYEQESSISSLPTADMPATEAGAILGTVAYMSPEQAQGKPADVRSDIFSFGLVLYEMLSGKRAFSGESPVATALALVKEEPPQIKTSPPLERIVRQCLAKQPEVRYQTISEVKEALEKVTEKVTISSAESEPSIAVLPFVNMSGDKEQEYFGDGLAEEIINALTQLPGLRVIARTSSFSFRGKEMDIAQIRDRLKVQSILEGSVRKSSNRIRVTAQLIDTANESHLWSERYDRDLTDVFAIQDEISQAIAEKLRVKLSKDPPRVRRHTKNMEAYNLYIKGRYQLYQAIGGALSKGREYFESAVALDPDYALAWFGLATYYEMQSVFALMSPQESNIQISHATLKALELDKDLPEAHAQMAVNLACNYDWPGAKREFHRALELGPEISDVWFYYTMFYLRPMKRFEDAIAAAEKALELDPLSPSRHNELGLQYEYIGQYDRSIEQYRKALELNPNELLSLSLLGLSLFQTGEANRGLEYLEKAINLSSRNPIVLGFIGRAYGLMGRTDQARECLRELQQLGKEAYAPPFSFASIYFGLGEVDQAFDWLEKAIDEHSPWIIRSYMGEPLRSHPRYKALLRKMNLEA